MAQSATNLRLIDNLKVNGYEPSDIRARVLELLDNGDMKLKDIEKATSFKSSTILQILHGKYDGDSRKALDSIASYYRYWLARYKTVKTHSIEEIHAVIELAWKRKEIAMVVGSFGKGKSEAALLYAVTHPDYAYFIELSGVSSTMELLTKIGEALDITDIMTGSASNRLAAIIRTLQRQPKLLIIDEADELKPRSLKLLRDIRGDREERCAIVLIATEKLFRLLKDPQLGYFESRIAIKYRAHDVEFEEVVKIANKFPHKLDKLEIKTAWEWAKKHHSLRSFVLLFQRAYDMMQIKDLDEIDSDCIKEAYSWLID
ncbi:MAG: ATP-binding protein [Candidatus Kryptoniota bacterium]